jgi:hypothetical protein
MPSILSRILRTSFPVLALLLVFAFFGEANATDVTLRRTPGSMLFGPAPAWATNTTEVFFPLSDPMPSAGMISVRVTTAVTQRTGFCQIKSALRYSSDGVGWATAVAIVDTPVDPQNSPLFDDDYVDITALGSPRPWIQFGVLVSNSEGTGISLCNATLLVEPKEK